ncbi:restriction endonuclease subunit R [Salegentibacter mishustinae]|uniref:Restriction endonuclease subunit R n=2 Tax=Salegentibacter mishustinae TaxID=270918 RepID=A0A0Q9Z6T0_9FLAO|nr:restriction endonuclease subunit R [Salegentibacter mishustinae]PNW22750.1 restriction endonuclease subunit R [Salegentibacter mishustinae]
MSMKNEAHARIKINKLLEEAGWRFFDNGKGKANILLENRVKITQELMDAWGNDYEETTDGSLDFLLLDSNDKPICVLEAKKESLHPLTAKEQARKYARSVDSRFIILSNGIIHFLWDLKKGNPKPIYQFPSADEIGAIKEWKPDRKALAQERISEDYIAKVQMPDYAQRPEWKGSVKDSKDFIWTNGLRFLRKYQIKAVEKLQESVKKGNDRFLFEMATGTGKTLTSAAVIRLFLRTENARRVLFLVDRLELEDQAWKAFTNYLKPDYSTFIYKEHKSDWRKADIIVTTIQSLMFNDKYRYYFKPTDFDLLISDESHRSISGNARAVFEYFHGYKLGLTATPKDYLKGVNIDKTRENDPREVERRLLRDTYSTFGCEGGDPTFRYSLLDGVKDGYLINPKVLDARTEITTQLLTDEGYAVTITNEEGEEEEEVFVSRDFEKKFFSEKTNSSFCQSFLDNALRDPITKEIGKSILFAVSQNHARKITEILNEFAEQLFPGKYNSDFAVQVTSQVADAQQMTINFTNNNLNGKTGWLEGYKSSKTRVCVTVGMMTTGYDCPDLLNICMMRPIFSPADFVQIKGRGTRKHTFEFIGKNDLGEEEKIQFEKEIFKLFDFFANCEYFEEKFDYDEKLNLPKPKKGNDGGEGDPRNLEKYTSYKPDPLLTVNEQTIGYEGMKIDRMLFKKFEDRIVMDDIIKKNVELGNWEQVVTHIQQEIFDKPDEYFDLEKLRKAAKIDRKVSIREVVEKIFGIIPKFKSKDELLEEEFTKFMSLYPPGEDVNIRALKYFFKAYIVDQDIRKIINAKDFHALQTNPTLTIAQFKKVDAKYREVIPGYIKDYINLKQFAA